jgi:UDP:flavonoid glycosyltransferase YjiC (YdhE family)
LWDTHPEAELAPQVVQFLDQGDRPIAFSPGSANREAHAFFQVAVDVCQSLGRRGILLTKYADQLPATLPPTVRHFGFVPLSKLLPHTAALVHHGGIGNCAQGLAAGVPHLIRPMSFDQFDNSRRLVQLGVGAEISVKGFRAPAAAAAIAGLLDSSTVAAKCRDFAARCNGPAALDSACEIIESLVAIPAAR